MKTLATEITAKGFTYRQVTRDGNVAIYSQHDHPSSKPGAYEVIIIQSHDGYEIGGAHIPAAESFPSTSAWGSKGWTFSCHLYPNALQLALDKMGQVKQAESMPKTRGRKSTTL